MNRSFTAISTVAALLMGSSAVIAQTQALEGDIEVESTDEFSEDGYATSDGMAIRTGLGECLKLGAWSEEAQNNACEGIEEVAEVEPEPEPAPAPAPEPTPAEPIVTTATLAAEALFDTDSDALSPASEQALADLLTQLESYQEISNIDVIGHTDSRGSEEYNQALSVRRAEAVMGFLQNAHPEVAMTADGMGETSPVATNSTPEGRQLNRRVEVQVTAKSITEPQS